VGAAKNAILALLVFAALYLLGRIPDYWPGLWRRIRYRGSERWPLHSAFLQEQRLELKATGRGPRYQAGFTYSYNIEGREYSGHFTSDRFQFKSGAERLLAKYPVHTSVMARVNPRRMEDSVLVLPE